MKTFNEKIVVITGAGSGIGRALSLEFGKLGARIALNDWDVDSLEETVFLLRNEGVKHIYASDFNVASNNDMQRFAREVQEKWGNAHIIVNNAGIEGEMGPAYLTAEKTYRDVMDVNFFGVINGCEAFMPQLVANNEGAVVNVSSVFGLVGMMNYSPYSASKFAVRGYTEALMTEFHTSPISIHCVHPGGIKTNISSSELSKKHLVTPPEDLAKYIIQSIKKNRPRIVYGSGSFKIWLSAKLLPMKIMKAILWKELSKDINREEYSAFLEGPANVVSR